MSVVVADNGGGGGHAPPPGVHRAVCSRVWDLGMQPGFEGKEQHKVVILWELDARIEEGEYAGRRFIVTNKYTASLNEKAKLRGDLESWRGRAFGTEELAGFDLEKLIGKNCQMNLVEYTKKNGSQGVKIASIMPPAAGVTPMKPELDEDYIPKWVADAMGETSDAAPVADTFDDDVPF